MKKKYNVVLFLSLFANLITMLSIVFLFFRFGGLVYFENKVAKVLSSEQLTNPIIEIRNENLELVGENQREIVFLGDSHTNYFEWSEYFSDKSVANRGIGSETSKGVLDRIKTVTELNPKKIFIMVGINDIQQEVSIESIEKNFVGIVNELKSNNPDVEVYIESILPVSIDLYERNFYRYSKPINEAVHETNEVLSKLEDVTFIDVTNKFGEDLPNRYTVDGIHLNHEGYKVWLDTLEEFID